MGSGDDPREPSRATDQVGLARDWLREHGVAEPAVEPLVAPRRGRKTEPAEVGTVVGAPEPDSHADDVEPDGEGGRGRGRRSRGRNAGARGADAAPGGLDPDADPEEVARTIVLRKLSAQARTRVELARALKKRDVPEEAASTVLDRMSELGLVDDATFARDWVASRQQRRHLSRTALRRELQTKGVDRDLIDDALAEVGGDDEHRAALDLARRRASSMGGLDREVAYRRLGGVLARRGFSSSVTVQVLAEVLDETSED